MKQAGLKAKISGTSFIVVDRAENLESNSLAALAEAGKACGGAPL